VEIKVTTKEVIPTANPVTTVHIKSTGTGSTRDVAHAVTNEKNRQCFEKFKRWDLVTTLQ
jgi:hypothetical protein